MSKPHEHDASDALPRKAAEALNLKEILGWAVCGGADNVAVNTMSVLAMPIYSIALGVNPALVGLATGIPRNVGATWSNE